MLTDNRPILILLEELYSMCGGLQATADVAENSGSITKGMARFITTSILAPH